MDLKKELFFYSYFVPFTLRAEDMRTGNFTNHYLKLKIGSDIIGEINRDLYNKEEFL